MTGQQLQPIDKDALKKEMYRYIDRAILGTESGFMSAPAQAKLSFLQLTPKNRIKIRIVGGKSIPYMPIAYYERALNLVSNFKWGGEITYRGDIIETIEQKKDKKTGKEYTTKKFEAMITCNMWIDLDGYKIERPTIGAWTSYENPATTRFDVYKSAYANAIKNFAKSFGIGADVQEEQNDAISEERVNAQKEVWKSNTVDYKGKLVATLDKKGLKTIESMEQFLKTKLNKEVDLETITEEEAQDLLLIALS